MLTRKFWMAAFVTMWLGCDSERARRSEQSQQAKEQAEAAATRAVTDASKAKQTVQALMEQVGELDAEIAKATDAVANAQNDADRTAAQAALRKLQMQQTQLEISAAEARAAAAAAERMKGKKLSKECLDNPQAKGCS